MIVIVILEEETSLPTLVSKDVNLMVRRLEYIPSVKGGILNVSNALT